MTRWLTQPVSSCAPVKRAEKKGPGVSSHPTAESGQQEARVAEGAGHEVPDLGPVAHCDTRGLCSHTSQMLAHRL